MLLPVSHERSLVLLFHGVLLDHLFRIVRTEHIMYRNDVGITRPRLYAGDKSRARNYFGLLLFVYLGFLQVLVAMEG